MDLDTEFAKWSEDKQKNKYAKNPDKNRNRPKYILRFVKDSQLH